jgi:hypothetical protein
MIRKSAVALVISALGLTAANAVEAPRPPAAESAESAPSAPPAPATLPAGAAAPAAADAAAGKPSAAAPQGAATNAPDGATARAAAADEDRTICRSEPQLGSRVRKNRICLKQSEWRAVERENEAGMKLFERRTATQPRDINQGRLPPGASPRQ